MSDVTKREPPHCPTCECGMERQPQPPNDVQRDAERYRTLREGNDYEHPGAMVVLCEQEHIDSDGRPFWSIAGELLDCYADRARAAETKNSLPLCDCDNDTGCKEYRQDKFRCANEEAERASPEKNEGVPK